MSNFPGINNLPSITGRMIKEDNTIINVADLLATSVPTKVPVLRKAVEVIRTAGGDTTPYTIGDIVNNASAASLPKINFGPNYANAYIQITGASVVTDGINKNFKIAFYNSSDINGAGGSIKADNAAFQPTYAEHIAKSVGQPLVIDNNDDLLNLQMRTVSEKIRKVQLDGNGEFYFAPLIMEALTPASGQKFTFAFYCYIL